MRPSCVAFNHIASTSGTITRMLIHRDVVVAPASSATKRYESSQRRTAKVPSTRSTRNPRAVRKSMVLPRSGTTTSATSCAESSDIVLVRAVEAHVGDAPVAGNFLHGDVAFDLAAVVLRSCDLELSLIAFDLAAGDGDCLRIVEGQTFEILFSLRRLRRRFGNLLLAEVIVRGIPVSGADGADERNEGLARIAASRRQRARFGHWR